MKTIFRHPLPVILLVLVLMLAGLPAGASGQGLRLESIRQQENLEESYAVYSVIMSVGAQNVEIPGGNVTEGARQLLVRTMGKYKSVEDFKKVIVATPKGTAVYLSDVAEVIDGIQEQTSSTRVNGKVAVGLNIIKQSGSNTVQVAKEVNKQIAKLKDEIPEGVSIDLAKDNSIFIKDSINDVLFDIFYGGLLAVLVIYLFLANFRATIISALALPTSQSGSTPA